MMFMKYHHCMGDGFTLARTLFTGAEVHIPESSEAKTSPRSSTEGGMGAGKALTAAAKLLTLQDDKPSLLKAQSLLKPLDPRIACFVTSKITITEIKKAAKSKGFTINDMVLAALSAALRKYQLQKRAMNIGTEVVDPLAAVWVALRPLAEAYTKQDADKVSEPGNTTLGAVYVRLPVTKEFDERADRVQAIYDEISKLKGSPEPLMAQGTMGLFGLMPSKLSNPIWNALSNKVSISVSNVPGPSNDFTWCGARLTGLTVFVPPVGTISTFCLITSFNDHITLSLSLDGTLFSKSDAAFITKVFDEELSLLTTSMIPSRM
jgi:hypothetical protein